MPLDWQLQSTTGCIRGWIIQEAGSPVSRMDNLHDYRQRQLTCDVRLSSSFVRRPQGSMTGSQLSMTELNDQIETWTSKWACRTEVGRLDMPALILPSSICMRDRRSASESSMVVSPLLITTFNPACDISEQAQLPNLHQLEAPHQWPSQKLKLRPGLCKAVNGRN